MYDHESKITVLQLPKFIYIVIAERIYLLRCYAKSERTNLGTYDLRDVRKIVAHLKGVQ